MTDDVRAAADMVVSEHTYCQHYGFTSWDNPTMQAALKLANAYLAEHPEDDEEPVNEEWLRSVGAASGFMDFDSEVWLDKIVRFSLSDISDVTVCNARPKNIKTRGEVRLLCRALGITLQEQANG